MLNRISIFRISALFLSVLILSTPETASSQDTGTTTNPETEAVAMALYIDGIGAFENEEYESALDLLSRAFIWMPESAGINYALADTYLALNDFSNATYYASRAVDNDPGNKWYHQSLALIYRQSGNLEAAIDVYQNLSLDYPGDISLLLELADLYAGLERHLDSNRIYNQILELRGPDPEIFLQRYRNFMIAGRPDSAVTELERMKRADPDNLTVLHTLSQLYLEMGDLDAAARELEDARRLNLTNVDTRFLEAEIFSRQQRWTDLGNTAVAIISDPANRPGRKLEIARFIYLQQQSQPGRQALVIQTRRVLEALNEYEPDLGQGHLMAAEFLLNRNETAAGLEKLEEANRLMPESADVWQQRLQLMFGNGRYNEVIEVGREAATFVPDDAFIQFFVGTSYMLTGHHESAIEWLENATLAPSRSSFRSVIYGTLGDSYTETDQWEQATRAYETAIQLDSNNHTTMNNYAYYMSLRNDRLERAQALIIRALQFEPDNPSYLDTAGWIYYKLGDYEQARDYVNRAINTGEGSAEVFEHMGDIYSALGMHELAETWWQRALEADPARSGLTEKLNL